MAAHLPHLLEMAGASATIAIATSALVGPAQVGARLIEFAGNGLLSIARGTLPLAVFGSIGYRANRGRRVGSRVSVTR